MIVKVKVFPNSNKEEVVKKSKDSFVIKTKAKPIGNKANIAVIELLASHLKITQSKIKLIKGIKSRDKTIEIFT